jgi:hypothetical protein
VSRLVGLLSASHPLMCSETDSQSVPTCDAVVHPATVAALEANSPKALRQMLFTRTAAMLQTRLQASFGSKVRVKSTPSRLKHPVGSSAPSIMVNASQSEALLPQAVSRAKASTDAASLSEGLFSAPAAPAASTTAKSKSPPVETKSSHMWEARLVERGEFDLADSGSDRRLTSSRRPKELVVHVSVPHGTAMADVAATSDDGVFRLKHGSLLVVEQPLRYPCDVDKGRVKFVRKTSQLTATFPVLPPTPQELELAVGKPASPEPSVEPLAVAAPSVMEVATPTPATAVTAPSARPARHNRWVENSSLEEATATTKQSPSPVVAPEPSPVDAETGVIPATVAPGPSPVEAITEQSLPTEDRYAQMYEEQMKLGSAAADDAESEEEETLPSEEWALMATHGSSWVFEAAERGKDAFKPPVTWIEDESHLSLLVQVPPSSTESMAAHWLKHNGTGQWVVDLVLLSKVPPVSSSPAESPELTPADLPSSGEGTGLFDPPPPGDKEFLYRVRVPLKGAINPHESMADASDLNVCVVARKESPGLWGSPLAAGAVPPPPPKLAVPTMQSQSFAMQLD